MPQHDRVPITLVVTSPDSTAAKAAKEGPLKELATSSLYKSVISTHDPYNTRCGSGGGTLAAMMLCPPDNTILIVHAGGESSRCPTQMVLGKSWTTLPCQSGHKDNWDNNQTVNVAHSHHSQTESDGTDNMNTNANEKVNSMASITIQSPTSWMLQTLHDCILQAIPKGSLVVAASDTLLQLTFETDPDATLDWTHMLHDCNDHSVLGVAVPAPLDTAKNHGVYVLPNRSQTDPAAGTNKVRHDNYARIQPVHQVLQKPHVTTIRDCSAAFTNHAGEPSAWIDTGIVIFMPKAVAALRELAQQELACCCWEGLKQMWETEKSDQITLSLEEFAKQRAHKVELYTHILMALSTTKSKPNLEDYLALHNDLPKHVLMAIYQKLSTFQLKALVIPTGQFLHLGTSQELLHFLVQGTNPSDDHSLPNDQRARAIARELRLVREYKALMSPLTMPLSSSTNNHSCTYNSLILTTGQLTIGAGSVLEHVYIPNATVDISIGSGCLISGWRVDYETITTTNIVIPDKTCLQVMPLLQDGEYVVMMLGLNDDIKGWKQIYGVDVDAFLKETALDDLWEPQEKQLLWSAKLHPVVTNVDWTKLFAWIHELQETRTIKNKSDLDYYKSCRRLSLEQIRRLSNAQQEWDYRYNLEHIILPLYSNLWNRQHVECHYVFNETTLATLSEICLKAAVAEKFDVCGRTFMVASAMLADQCLPVAEIDEAPRELEVILESLRNSSNRISSCKMLFDACTRYIQKSELAGPGLALEQAALIMTELCVCGKSKPSLARSVPTLGLRWIVATAPARVDLSGGWSDTPPICFEYGGAVAGFAATVDSKKPLSCRSRLVPGGNGIRLCTESRDAVSGELLSNETTRLFKIGDLHDYRNPMADCALAKCALVCLGLVPDTGSPTDDLQPRLQSFCGIDEQIGLEIISTSLLPRGSGLGTSSILAGCVIASISKCVGINLGENDENRLIHIVLLVEQLLTCGGGWQDQVGGLIGGIKLGTSKANIFPVVAHIERVEVGRSTIEELDSRLILVFTGQTRLAKNILQNVLRRWSRRTPEIVRTIEALVRDAHRTSKALHQGDFETLAECLNSYWCQKKVMAGNESGVEPEVVRCVLAELFRHGEIVAGSLCGAGGGGFMVLITAKGRTMMDVKSTFDKSIVPLNEDATSFTWHQCQVSSEGIRTFQSATSADFEISWHSE